MAYCDLNWGTCPLSDCEKHIDNAPGGCAVEVRDMSRDCEHYQGYRKRVDNMTDSQAMAIFCDIEDYGGIDEEKGWAIWKVLAMPTHNSITKDQMLKVIRYLLGLSFDLGLCLNLPEGPGHGE